MMIVKKPYAKLKVGDIIKDECRGLLGIIIKVYTETRKSFGWNQSKQEHLLMIKWITGQRIFIDRNKDIVVLLGIKNRKQLAYWGLEEVII